MISIEGLEKHYQMGDALVKALDGVTLNIDEGEFVAIMGPSGSGKSTLMNILGCLDRPTNGSYSLRGTNVATLDDDRLAEVRNKEIGFVFQTFNLLPRLTAVENVALPLSYAGIVKAVRLERAHDKLNLVGLAERSTHRPNELSGGQRQRVAIARALINEPAMILADEPTGNLDSKTAREILGLLQELNDKGHTVVMVTHDADVAANAKRTIHVRDGKVS
ncbi:MAG: ABC transporter ATP-binding protein [Acidobacteriota bacterium]